MTTMNLSKDFTLTLVLEEDAAPPPRHLQCAPSGPRWDTLHQCLLMLLDSPLNHAGHLEVYISLADGKCIRTHREIRIPRTLKRFEQLFNNFLDGCDMPVVQTKQGPAKLMQFVGKASLQKLLQASPANKFKILNLAPKLKSPSYFTEPLAAVAGEQAAKRIVIHLEFGPVDFNALGCGREQEYEVKTINKYPDQETFSISQYPLSASLTCVKLTSAFERALEVF